MKKNLLIVLIVISGLIVWIYAKNTPQKNIGVIQEQKLQSTIPEPVRSVSDKNQNPSQKNTQQNHIQNSDQNIPEEPSIDSVDITDSELEEKAEVKYSSSVEALAAVKAAALDFNENVLNSFNAPSANCKWCPEFYSSLKELLSSSSIADGEREYFSNVLAASGQVDNISFVIDAAAKEAQNPEILTAYTSALSSTLANDEVLLFLKGQLNQENEELRQAIITAISNQGTKLAAEILYGIETAQKTTGEEGEISHPLSDFVPDDETLPYLGELLAKQDRFSPFALNSMLNAGISGIQAVISVLENNSSLQITGEALSQATEHIVFDEETTNYLKSYLGNSNHSTAKLFAKSILENFELEEKEFVNQEQNTTK